MPERAGNAEYVDAPVGIEVLVLDRDDSLMKDGSEIAVINDDALLSAKEPMTRPLLSYRCVMVDGR